MFSAACSVNTISTASGTVDITASTTCTIALLDATGANFWTVSAIYPDDTVDITTLNSSISLNQTTKTATFTSPSAGSVIFRSVINNGIDVNGNAVPSYTSEFKVSIPVASIRTICSHETTQGSPIFGTTKAVNDAIRALQTGGGGGGGSFTAGGDLTGTSTSQTVSKIQGVTVSGTAALNKTLVATSSSAASWATPPGGAPSGSASGDLSGSYPGPTVAKVNGASVPPAGALVTGNVLKVTGGSVISYGAVNLAGGSNHVTGTLPAANQANQSISGDVTGNTAASVVGKLQGITVSAAAPSNGQSLVYSSGTTSWGPGTITGGGGTTFTAAGDLTGDNTTQQVVSLTGSAGVVAFPTSTTAPTLSQANNTTAGAAAQPLSLKAQSATGTTSTGGQLTLSSGSGTTQAGTVKIQTGGQDKLTITPASVSIAPTQINRTGNANTKVWEDYASIQTTNNVQTTAYTIPLVNNAHTHIDVLITAINSTKTAGATFKRSADYRQNAGTAAQIGSTQDGGSNVDTGMTFSATLDRSGTSARVLVTGATGFTLRWAVYISVLENTA